ncbi:MAG: amidase family protein, partial [Francisellaceae bacterium]
MPPTVTDDPFMERIIKIPYKNGKLSGLKFAVKDNIDLSGSHTGYGNPAWRETHDTAYINAICVDQLLAEGATCLGKTITDELAYSLIGINDHYGTPVNHKAPEHVPGGSSSGSASAVSAALLDFAVGTDTAGSIRVPASNCGIWGWRPTHGIISLSGVTALAPDFDTVGIMAQSGDILERVINIFSNASKSKNHKYELCLCRDFFAFSDTEVQQALTSPCQKLEAYCNSYETTLAHIFDTELSPIDLFECSAPLISAEIANHLLPWVNKHKGQLSHNTRLGFENHVETVDRTKLQTLIRQRQWISSKLNDYLSPGRILCFPTTPMLAPKLEDINEPFMQG